MNVRSVLPMTARIFLAPQLGAGQRVYLVVVTADPLADIENLRKIDSGWIAGNRGSRKSSMPSVYPTPRRGRG